MSSGITKEYIDSDVFEVLKHSGSEINRLTLDGYKGPHRALGCEVLGGSSSGRLPSHLLVLRLAIGSNKLATAATELRHLCTHI
jgi:hypothetical protein